MLVLVVIARALGACGYESHVDDCRVSCADDGACPDGLICGDERLCREPGSETSCVEIRGAPSCVDLAPTCGPAENEDCCAAGDVPGGSFFRSYDVGTDGLFNDMSHPATIRSFTLDKFEVTVGRFRRFVEEGGGTQDLPPSAGAGAHAQIPGSGWDEAWNGALPSDKSALISTLKCDPTYQTWTDVAGPDDDLPANCVTWYMAFAFCIWDGGYLPTETEWNFAAAGGDQQRAYPWSSPGSSTAIDCALANYKIDAPSRTFCTNDPIGGVEGTGSGGLGGAGRFGHSALAGNVAEWTLDAFRDPYPDPCDDCFVPDGPDRVIRGSGFTGVAVDLRTAIRNPKPPSKRAGDIGFRCARTPTR